MIFIPELIDRFVGAFQFSLKKLKKIETLPRGFSWQFQLELGMSRKYKRGKFLIKR
jgi:hypothetical protein